MSGRYTSRADRARWELTARRMREQGATYSEIEEVTGCGRTALARWLADVPRGGRPKDITHGSTSA